MARPVVSSRCGQCQYHTRRCHRRVLSSSRPTGPAAGDRAAPGDPTHPHPLAPRSNPRRARAPPPRSRVATTPSRRGVPLARLPLLLLRPITSPPRPLGPVALPHSRSPRTTILRSGGSHVFHARRKAAESQRPFSPWPPHTRRFLGTRAINKGAKAIREARGGKVYYARACRRLWIPVIIIN